MGNKTGNQRLLPRKLVKSYGIDSCITFEVKLKRDRSRNMFVKHKTIEPLNRLCDLQATGYRLAGREQLAVFIE